MIEGFDSTIVSNIPRDAGAVVCYMDGDFNNAGEARAQFPGLAEQGRIVTLTARLSMAADGIDIEPGNEGPVQGAGWLRDKLRARAHRPLGYADLSDMRTVISQLHLLGIPTPAPGPGRPTRLYSAHPTGIPHICGPTTCGFPVEMDATQWWWSSLQNPGGPDLDRDLFRDDFFELAPTPHPIGAKDMITAVVNKDGRLEVFVEKSDTGEVFHAFQHEQNGAWEGAEPKVRNAAWYPLGIPGK